MEKFQEHLQKADSCLKTADHLIYITFPLIKESRLLKKILEGVGETAYNIFRGILEHEYLYKRINLHQDERLNFETFKRCSVRYNLTMEEIGLIQEVFALLEKHKESPFEFVRKDRLIMMSENLKTESINSEQLKKYLNQMKGILAKVHAVLDKRII